MSTKSDLSMFSIPDPAAIRQRNQMMRQEAWSSGNPYAMQQATTSNFLDAVFGNPEEKRAQKIQQAVSVASQIEPQEGDDDIDTEMRRLFAIRNAVAEIDPQLAGQVNTRMLQLGQQRLERNKLLADEQRAQRKEGRDEAKLALDVQKAATDMGLKSNNDVSYWRRGEDGKIHRRTVAAGQGIERQRLRDSGWTQGPGPNTEAEAADMLSGKAVGTLEDVIINTDTLTAALGEMGGKFDSSYLTLPEQLVQGGLAAAEKMGIPLSPELVGRMEGYSEWKQTSIDALNKYINQITGAAVGVQEEKRIRAAFPDPQKDSPTQYISKLRQSYKMALGGRKRAERLLRSGVTRQLSPKELDAMGLDEVSDAEVDALLYRMHGIPPRTSGSPGGPRKPAATAPASGPGFAPSAAQQSLLDKYGPAVGTR